MASTPTQSDQLLRRAMEHAGKGDFARAQALAEQGLVAGADRTPFHAFLGMLHARSGNAGQAITHLSAAQRARPADVTIACNLIAVLTENGRDSDALEVASAERAFADRSLRLARYRAFLAQQLGSFEEAAAAYEFILASAPDDFESLNNLGNARAGLGDHEGAVAALRRALEVDPRAAPTWLNLASALIALERNEEAETLLRDATHAFPDDWHPPYQLYVLLKALLRQDEAVAALEAAVARDPDVAHMQLKLAVEYGVLRRTAEAERAYRRTIALDPHERDAYLGLAIQYEHTNREEEFAPLIELARANGLGDAPLAFMEALELRRQNRFEDALARLEAVSGDIEPIRTVHMRATLLDRLERSDEAYAAYAEANRLMADNTTDPLGRAAGLRQALSDEIALLTPQWRDSWQPVTVSDDRPDPVFLLGFPRSGTTLLDTFLMGHPGTAVMEEQPPLNHVEEALGGLAAIPALDAAGVTRARDQYFAEVAQVAQVPEGRLLIDKSPLFLYRLPLIRRLFPKAKVILALRHPCDVVLSCFMSNFRLNSAMANFLRLDDAAQFYDLCFGHWRTARTLFPEVPVHTVRYEDLVGDVAGQLRPLLDWLDLDWHDAALDHQQTARSRGLITTASYSQVTEPIYRRGVARWERYRDKLEPILPVLAPWAEEFGYTL